MLEPTTYRAFQEGLFLLSTVAQRPTRSAHMILPSKSPSSGITFCVGSASSVVSDRIATRDPSSLTALRVANPNVSPPCDHYPDPHGVGNHMMPSP